MAAITTSRSWAILDLFMRRGDDGSSHSLVARLTNSLSDPFEVCIEINATPRPSNLILRWPDGPTDGELVEPIATHVSQPSSRNSNGIHNRTNSRTENGIPRQE
jgi:hypothetical protein